MAKRKLFDNAHLSVRIKASETDSGSLACAACGSTPARVRVVRPATPCSRCGKDLEVAHA